MSSPTEKERAYICGPMRGHKYYNFPMFHEAAALLRRERPLWDVINPALNDECDGFDPYDTKTHLTPEFLQKTLVWDIEQIIKARHIVLLPGWEHSRGVALELHAFWTCGDVPKARVWLLEGDPLWLPGCQSAPMFYSGIRGFTPGGPVIRKTT